MDRKLREDWVTALRSGKYQQGQGKLKDGTDYCCLGVLCDVSGFGEWDEDRYVVVAADDDGSEDDLGVVYLEGDLEHLSGPVFGLWNSLQGTLVQLNDGEANEVDEEGRRWTFQEIADFIETKRI